MVPTVVCMIVKGISSMDNPKKLGRISLEIVIFYVVTTVIATLIGMLVAEVFQPGIGFQFSESADPGLVSEISRATSWSACSPATCSAPSPMRT